MIAQLAHYAIHFCTIGDHGTAIAKTPEVLLNYKAGAGSVTELTDAEPIAARPDALGVVFNHKQAVEAGDFANRLHVGALTVEVDRHQRLRPGRDGRFDLGGIDTVGQRV